MGEASGRSRPGILSGRRLVITVVVAVVVLVGGGLAFALHSAGKSDDDIASRSPAAEIPVTAARWKRIVPGGDCHCADGSEFAFWDRRADPTKVVLYMDGGGVCWTAKSCTFTSTDSPGENDFYDWSLESEDPEPGDQGIFDFARTGNPFADYSFIYVSSCSGDAYLGNVSQKYSPELTVEHRGYVNGTAALDYLAKHYPDAAQVVVVGKTAGAVAAPIYGGLVADRLPNAKVTVFGAQSGAWPDNPDFNTRILGKRWGAYNTMPGWAVEGLTVREWGVPRFWTQSGLHNPNLVLARFDYAFDSHAAVEVTKWLDKSLLATIDGNEEPSGLGPVSEVDHELGLYAALA